VRNGYLILLAMVGLVGCDGAHLHVGDDGLGGRAGSSAQAGSSGQAGSSPQAGSSGQAGAPAGTGGTIVPPGTGGTIVPPGTGGTIAPPGTGGTGAVAGQSGTGGASGTVMLLVTPTSATFASTLVEAVSASQTFAVRNDGDGAAAGGAILAALVGTNAADFSIASNGCGVALQPGASCDVAIAFAPKTRSGPRTAGLTVSAPTSAAATVSLSGTALPSLGLLAGHLGGSGTVDGTGAAARFMGPTGLVSDGAGTLYITDGGETVRKVALATGTVTTFAGAPSLSGTADGTGAAARFSYPAGIASDGAGNLFVADSGNATIRKIVLATGAVTTFAGQPGAPGNANGRGPAAQFWSPSGIASDGAGNLYVADTYNSTIRKIVIATRTVTTFAGSGTQSGNLDGTGNAARFTQPTDIVSDGAGNLFVADATNQTIRKIVIATRAVTTLAGMPGVTGGDDGTGGGAMFNYPSGITIDGAGNLFVADTTNGTIRKIVIATGEVTTLAGAATLTGATDGTGNAARFLSPSRLVSDGAGNLIVADNNTLRKVVIATGAVTTIAGAAGWTRSTFGTSWADSLDDPFGVATDGAGNLFVADTYHNLIRKVDLASGTVTTFAGGSGVSGGSDGTGTGANFYQPQGITSDGMGNLYVADTYDDSIRKIVVATGVVTTIAGAATQPGSDDGIGAAARFAWPSGVASDGAGNLFVADTNNYAIRQIVVATGAVTTLAGTPHRSGFGDGTGPDAYFAEPTGIAADGAGNLYVADTSNCTIRKIVIATRAVTTLAGAPNQCSSADGIGSAARLFAPWGLSLDGAGNLYVADDGNDTIRKIVVATGAVTTLAGTAGQTGTADGTGATARFDGASGLVSDGAGNLYVADTYNNSIRKVAVATATVSTIAGAPALTGSADGIGASARFTSPTGIAADAAGNVYVTDGSDTLRQIALATRAVTTFAGAPGQQGDVDGIGVDSRFTRLEAIVGDGSGTLYVADGLVIRQVTAPAGAVTTVAGSQNVWGVPNQFVGPTGVVGDGAGNLYVTDTGLDQCNCVRKVVIATGAVSILAGNAYDTIVDGTGPDARFLGPRGIATDGVGNLYVTDGTIIRQVVIATGVVSMFAGEGDSTGTTDGVGFAARFTAPSGIAGDGAGHLYVADGNTIRKIDLATATVSTVIGAVGQIGVAPGALPATLNVPFDVTVLPTGELAIIDSGENAVLIGHL
jgi:hypothetical protein